MGQPVVTRSDARVVIIGAGHNGLVTACYLARAGLAPLVLERRGIVGGTAITEELYPDFRCPTLAHTAGGLSPGIVNDLDLAKYGFMALRKPAVRVFAPDLDGRALRIYEDPVRTTEELKQLSGADSASYPAFVESFNRISAVLAPLMTMTPPDINSPGAGALWNFGKLGLRFRGLSKKDAFRLLRWGPMPVADLAEEWFSSELLRATVQARALHGTFAGPHSAGTGLGLLFEAATSGGHAIAPANFLEGGMGALTQALRDRALSAGVEVRTDADVRQIQVEGNRATGVVLASGEEIPALGVVSNADPRHTLLGLVDPVDLDPDFLVKIGNYRCRGSAAKVNLALSGLPDFDAAKSNGADSLAGRIHIGPETDYLERAFDAAKYGDYSPNPYMEITIPSITDPTLAPSGAHVMSVYVQHAPYDLKSGDWSSRRDEFGDSVVGTLSAYAPRIGELILHRQVITPVDLERTYGLTGGHMFHGEPSLDQSFAFRPILGSARYRTPIDGLFLCGAGTHPGGGVTGLPGLNASREIVSDLKRENS